MRNVPADVTVVTSETATSSVSSVLTPLPNSAHAVVFRPKLPQRTIGNKPPVVRQDAAPSRARTSLATTPLPTVRKPAVPRELARNVRAATQQAVVPTLAPEVPPLAASTPPESAPPIVFRPPAPATTRDVAVITVPAPAQTLTALPTNAPVPTPTQAPTVAPTQAPTLAPTIAPTQAPPTVAPTQAPTIAPTQAPTVAPTQVPTVAPTQAPTLAPIQPPTVAPTRAPTASPTRAPTRAPTAIPKPEVPKAPVASPTVVATVKPVDVRSAVPAQHPSSVPDRAPTQAPSNSRAPVAAHAAVTAVPPGNSPVTRSTRRSGAANGPAAFASAAPGLSAHNSGGEQSTTSASGVRSDSGNSAAPGGKAGALANLNDRLKHLSATGDVDYTPTRVKIGDAQSVLDAAVRAYEERLRPPLDILARTFGLIYERRTGGHPDSVSYVYDSYKIGPITMCKAWKIIEHPYQVVREVGAASHSAGIGGAVATVAGSANVRHDNGGAADIATVQFPCTPKSYVAVPRGSLLTPVPRHLDTTLPPKPGSSPASPVATPSPSPASPGSRSGQSAMRGSRAL